MVTAVKETKKSKEMSVERAVKVVRGETVERKAPVDCPKCKAETPHRVLDSVDVDNRLVLICTKCGHSRVE